MADALFIPLTWMVVGIVIGIYLKWAWSHPYEKQTEWLHTIQVRPDDIVDGDGELWDQVVAYLLAGEDVELMMPADTRQRLRELEREGL